MSDSTEDFREKFAAPLERFNPLGLLKSDARQNLPRSNDNVDVIWGVGGDRGPALLGGLKLLEDRNIPIGTETGVSAGSLIAAFHTNGYSSSQIEKIFSAEFNKEDGLKLLRSIKDDDDFASWALGSSFNHRAFIERIVRKYNLEPNERLQIVSYDILSGRPVLFKGTGYDLTTALEASTALPGHLAPVFTWSGLQPRLLVDGGLYKLTPVEFSRKSSIGFLVNQDTEKLRQSIERTSSWLKPWAARIVNPMLERWSTKADPEDHIVGIEIDPRTRNRYASLDIALMVSEGYQQSRAQLSNYHIQVCRAR